MSNAMMVVDGLDYRVVQPSRNSPGFALDHISFSLETGYIMGLLGRNGSGKSSLLRLLHGMDRPDSGSICWKGQDIFEDLGSYRQKTAYIAPDSGFFYYRSLWENISLLGNLYDAFDQGLLEQYITKYGLGEKMDVVYAGLSTGERRKFQLAFALAHQPELLLLDELTAGLDPIFRTEWIGMIQDLVAEEEITVILSTHILSDINEIVDYIVMLDEGKLVLCGDRETVLEQQGMTELEELF